MELIHDSLLSSSLPSVLIIALVKASIVLALLQLTASTVRGLSSAMKHLLLTAGLAAFLLIPLLALLGPDWRVAVPAQSGFASVDSRAGIFGLSAGSQPAAADQKRVRASSGSARTAPMLSSTEAPEDDADSTAALSLGQVAALLWMFVALAVLAPLFRSASSLRAIVVHATIPSPRLLDALIDARRRLSVDRTVRLLQSDRVTIPMVWGVRTGTLLLPEEAEEWTDEQLHSTLIHELGHLQRLDYVSLAVMNLAAALFWFHPQIWMARRHAIVEGERACDDLVLRSGARASEYASHLLRVARSNPPREQLEALLAMSRPLQLEERVVAILSQSNNRQSVGGKQLMISFASFVALVLPFSIVQITAQPAGAAPTPVAVASRAPAAVVPPIRARQARPATRSQPVTGRTPRAMPALPPLPPAPPSPVMSPPPPIPLAPLAPLAASTPPAPPAPPRPPVRNAQPATTPRAPRPPLPAIPPVPALAPPALPAIPATPRAERISSPPAPPSPSPSARPAPLPTPAPTPQRATAPKAAGNPTVQILSESGNDSRPFRVIGAVRGRSCTIKLKRPVGTGDPTRNPAEALATERLLRRAAARGANAVKNLRCYREIAIGFGCPTAVECDAEAIWVDQESAR